MKHSKTSKLSNFAVMEENNSLMPQKANEEQLFAQIKQMLDNARKQIAHAVNSTTIEAYWQVGKYIVEYEQSGKTRAEYGKGVITSLSKRLMAEYGGGFTITNLKMKLLDLMKYYIKWQSHKTKDDSEREAKQLVCQWIAAELWSRSFFSSIWRKSKEALLQLYVSWKYKGLFDIMRTAAEKYN